MAHSTYAIVVSEAAFESNNKRTAVGRRPPVPIVIHFKKLYKIINLFRLTTTF